MLACGSSRLSRASTSRLAASGPTVRITVRGEWPATSSASATSITADPRPSAGLAVKPGTRSGRVSSRSWTCCATSSGMIRESRTSATWFLQVGGFRCETVAAEQDGQQNQGQGSRAEQAADDHNGQRALHLGARAAGEEHGHQAEGGDAGGHHHRPQAAFGAFDHDVGQAHAAGQ